MRNIVEPHWLDAFSFRIMFSHRVGRKREGKSQQRGMKHAIETLLIFRLLYCHDIVINLILTNSTQPGRKSRRPPGQAILRSPDVGPTRTPRKPVGASILNLDVG